MTGAAQVTHAGLTQEPVAIIAVDLKNRIAQGLSRNSQILNINFNMPVGSTYIVPDKGDQWYVDRLDNVYWKLTTRLPFNDNNTTVEPVAGQTIIGGTGPVVLNGSSTTLAGDTNVNGILGVGGSLLQTISGVLSQSSDGGTTWAPVGSGSGGIDPNPPIDPGTFTKITFDASGLVTGGADATVADIDGLAAALASISAGAVPLSTKGDLVTFDTAIVRLGVGADGTFLKADSTQDTGLDWGLIGIADILHLDTLLSGFGTGNSILNQLIGLFTGTTGGLSGLSGLGSIFGDLLGILGNPSSIGSGSPLLSGISSIPILGGLLSGAGTILTSLIGGLDASSIISGLFPQSMISGLPTSLAQLGIDFEAEYQKIYRGITGLTGTLSDVNLTTWSQSLVSMLGSPNFNLSSFNPVTAVQNFINTLLAPSGPGHPGRRSDSRRQHSRIGCFQDHQRTVPAVDDHQSVLRLDHPRQQLRS